jgi:hypothetical protein
MNAVGRFFGTPGDFEIPVGPKLFAPTNVYVNDHDGEWHFNVAELYLVK